MPPPAPLPPDFDPAELCSACGMCCNGVLFHTVELQAGDNPRAIASLGVKLKRKAGKVTIQQPCPAFKQSCCSIYAERPERCRLFECRQLLGAKAGEISREQALGRIHAATSLAQRLLRHGGLFERLGELNVGKPRAKRFNNLMADLAQPDPNSAPLLAEMVAVTKELEGLLDLHFRVQKTVGSAN